MRNWRFALSTFSEPFPVLDKGYVRLETVSGNDLSPVNDARVSFGKKSSFDVVEDWVPGNCSTGGGWVQSETQTLKEKDQNLIRDLIELGHSSPLQHATMHFEIKAPIMVVDQWMKSKVGGPYTEEEFTFKLPPDGDEAWNQKSFRYVSRNLEFYVPDKWRQKPQTRKQGSDGFVDPELSEDLYYDLSYKISESLTQYRMAVDQGVAPEQARLFLPYAALYTTFRWRPSLYRVLTWLQLREAEDAQWEIREYTYPIKEMLRTYFPNVYDLWYDKLYVDDLLKQLKDRYTRRELLNLVLLREEVDVR